MTPEESVGGAGRRRRAYRPSSWNRRLNRSSMRELSEPGETTRPPDLADLLEPAPPRGLSSKSNPPANITKNPTRLTILSSPMAAWHHQPADQQRQADEQEKSGLPLATRIGSPGTLLADTRNEFRSSAYSALSI